MTAALEIARKIQIPAVILTIVAAVLLPVLVHLIPSEAGAPPLGARLLPIFIAPLVAILLGYPIVGLVASLVMPSLNHLLTGRPPAAIVASMTLELTVFSLIVGLVWWKLPRSPLRYVIAPLAYIVALAVATLAQTITQSIPAPFEAFTNSLIFALPGLVVLLLVNLVVAAALAQSAEQSTK